MLNMMRTYLGTYVKNQKGQGMVEYALIIALIAVLLIAVLGLMQVSLEDIFTTISTTLDTAGQ